MNYLKIYRKLIKVCRKRNKTLKYGFEKHHIKPKSLFPKLAKDKSNIVKLTYREHYVAHWLLSKIYPCKQMIYAFWRMNCCQNDIYFNSYAYKHNREECIKLMKEDKERAKNISKSRTGHIVSKETREKISKSKTGHKMSKEWCKEHSEKMKRHRPWNLGKHHSEETKLKMGISHEVKIYCVELDKVFDSMKKAADSLNLKRQLIWRVCNNQRKSTGGYHFKYLDNK